MMAQKWSFKITLVRKVLIALVALSVILAVYRLATGLGASTNLNDNWPWGLWIGFDLTAIALAGGGYSICLLVHILGINKFNVIARRALLFSLLSYIFVLGTLFLEIGRWYNFWRPFVSWGYHSAMFEVFMCISAYILVQLMEFSEIATEKVAQAWHRPIKKILPVIFILGALLPFGHQASLGALYLIAAGKLHPLWWSPLLPWLFLISSFFVGSAMITIETLWAGKVYNHKVDTKVLRSLIHISGSMMVVYLFLKIIDLINRNAFGYVFTGKLESNMFLLEIIVGVIIPIIICFSSWSATNSGLLAFSILTAAGVIINRVNVVFTGMHKALGPGYTPAWTEWAISIGLIATVVLAYMFIVENFNIFGYPEKHHYAAHRNALG